MMNNSYQKAVQIVANPLFVKQNYVVSKAQGWQYLRYRFLRPLLKVYDRTLKLGKKDIPWLSPAAIAIIGACLDKKMIGLEYGSGKSTLYFARKLDQLISVEHYEVWYRKVKTIIDNSEQSNIDYQLIRPEKVTISETENQYLNNQFENNNFPEVDKEKLLSSYIQFIDSFENEHFDFILIDGRARELILPKAIPKLKSGGMLVLDNSERDRYQASIAMLNTWPKVQTTTGLTDTTFWFKP